MSPASRTWFITGCDKGIGRAVAEAALERGHRVVATVLASDGRSPLTEQYGDRCLSYHLDVTDAAAVRSVVGQAEAATGGIGVLVNNAGFGLLGAAEEVEPADYRRMFDVNFFGMVEVTRAVLPGMRARREGRIVNFSSIVGFVGAAGYALYAASKFAVEGFTESLAKETAPLGIRPTIVEPGAFRSDFAGGSLLRAKTVIDDYAETSGATRTFMETRHGSQPGDPARLGAVLVDLVERPDPPLRLALGSDALTVVLAKTAQLQAEYEGWREVSLSTNFAGLTEQRDLAM